MAFPYLQAILFLTGVVLAQPLPVDVISGNSSNAREIIPTRFTQRSEWNIIWSCLATLFACSWVAIHPNIPPSSDDRWRILSRRLLTMFYTLLAPEMVIVWAGRQWNSAREIAQRNKDHGWTQTHAFFALMGGFMLYEDGTMSRTLAPDELEHLFAEGRINWPIITGKEIEDKSKNDIFSKCFAILQTTWFVAQCTVRGVYGLPLSHLEVVTVAFAALNAVVYFLWWNKPMDVLCPVPVHLLPPLTDIQRFPSKRETGIQAGDQYHSVVDGNNGSQFSSLQPPTSDLVRSGTEPSDRSNPPLATKLEIESNLPAPHSSIPLQPSSTFARVCSYIWGKFLSMGPFAIIYILICKPVKTMWSDIGDMLECNKVDNHNGTQSVPTFYAPDSKNAPSSIFTGLAISILFGGIHCAPWYFPFPSIKQQCLWRISAVIITTVFVFLIILSIVCTLIIVTFVNNHEGPWAMSFIISSALFASLIILLYTVARVVLLILPFLALRSLPSGSFVAVYWFDSVPHI